MIILKIIVFIWAVSSILLSLFLLFCYCYVGKNLEGLRKRDLLLAQLNAPYWVVYIVTRLNFKDVITTIKKRKLKRNGNNT